MIKNLILAFLFIAPFSLYSQNKNKEKEQLNVNFMVYDNDTLDFEIKKYYIGYFLYIYFYRDIKL